MGARYELKKEDSLSIDIVKALVKAGVLLELEHPSISRPANFVEAKAQEIIKNLSVPELPPVQPGYLRIEQSDNIPCDGKIVATIGHYENYENASDGVDRFLKNHLAIEVNFEIIAKENLGLCEDRKDWLKTLKAAVKEYGHDQLIEAFYEWSIAQGSFMGRRPVTSFLKNIQNNISVAARKPLVTNPSLAKVEERIAYISNNKVFFTGDYRVKLAALLKDFGPQLITEAFEQFFQDVEEKSINWAARDFLQRASVMITIIQRKKAEAKAQEDLLAATYQQAKESVEEVQEEEEESL